jgi:deoxycytidylate deaminase
MYRPCPDYARLDDVAPKLTTDKQRAYLERAAKLAMKSTMSHRHGCVVVLNGGVVSEGYNRQTTHMFHSFSVHAEADALFKIKKMGYPLNDAEMYVVRIATSRFDHCLKYSKPCKECQNVIKKMGVRKVYYSTNSEYEQLWRQAHEADGIDSI